MFPFKGIVDKEYIPCGLEVEEWMGAKVSSVFLSDLYLTQNEVYTRQLFVDSFTGPIWVGSWYDQLYIYNGHHRVVKAALRGDLTITARVCII